MPSYFANRIRKHAESASIDTNKDRHLDARWSLWMVLFGQAADNRLFAKSWLWYIRVAAYAVMAAAVVATLVLTHVLILTAPVAVLVTFASALAFNFGLDFLRDHLVPTMANTLRLDRPWLQWFSRSNYTDEFGHGKMMRQMAASPAETAYFGGNKAARDIGAADTLKDRTRLSSVRNANQSLLRGFMFTVFALLTVAAVSAALTPAGLLSLAIPAVTSLAFAVLAWGFNRLAIHFDQAHRTVNSDGKGFDPKAHPGWQWLSHGLYATSGLCAAVSVVAIAWVGWPQAMIGKAMVLFHMPTTVTAASLATQAAVLGGFVTAMSLAAGFVVGSIRSLKPSLSAAKVTGTDFEANQIHYQPATVGFALSNVETYLQTIGPAYHADEFSVADRAPRASV